MNRDLLNPSDMSNEDARKAAYRSPVQNPLLGAIIYGLTGAACVSIGAAIRKNDIHAEAITVLCGGLLSGGIAGLLGTIFLVINPRSLITYESFLQCGAFFSAPILGISLIRNDMMYTNVLIDSLVGSCIIFGCACILILFSLLPLLSSTAEPYRDNEEYRSLV